MAQIQVPSTRRDSQGKAERQIAIFLHGQTLTKLQPGSPVETFPITEALDQIRANKDLPLLLGAPYINTFTHESIPLEKKDLTEVNQHLLPFSTTPMEDRQVHHFPISPTKALTIHTHLTPTGKDLLQRLKGSKIFVRWQSAILFLTQQLLSNPQTQEGKEESLRVIFEEECVELVDNGYQRRVSHCNTWQSDLDPPDRVRSLLSILEVHSTTPSANQLSLCPIEWGMSEIVPSNFSECLLFYGNSKQQLNCIAHKGKKGVLPRIRTLSPVKFTAILLLVVLLWAGILQFRLHQFRQEKKELQQRVERLNTDTRELVQIAKVERKLAQFDNLELLKQKFQINPIGAMRQIDQALFPTHLWLTEFRLTENVLSLSIVGPKKLTIEECRGLGSSISHQEILATPFSMSAEALYGCQLTLTLEAPSVVKSR